jgi:hypothetical protein
MTSELSFGQTGDCFNRSKRNSDIFISIMEIAPLHIEELRKAKRLLEEPSLAARITNAVGAPIEKGFKLLPDKWNETLNKAVEISLAKALSVAVRSLGKRSPEPPRLSRERFHRFAVIASGAGGGAFGLAGLVVELPVSTTLILRSIADIASEEGEDLSQVESRLRCLEVFALGGPADVDDAVETGYFAVRSALAKSVSEAGKYVTQKGVVDRGAPVLVRFLSRIGSRFGIVVSEKMAAMAVPAIGAVSGAAVNAIFIRHFQDVARGHFIVRRLEKQYGAELIRLEYRNLTI